VAPGSFAVGAGALLAACGAPAASSSGSFGTVTAQPAKTPEPTAAPGSRAMADWAITAGPRLPDAQDVRELLASAY
jgi:hypothetical protein